MIRLRHAGLILLAAVTTLTGADYHVVSNGDDARDGRPATTAGRTLGRIPMEALGPGDRIVLRAGDHFAGHGRVLRGGDARQLQIITRIRDDRRASQALRPGAGAVNFFVRAGLTRFVALPEVGL